jgi:hypothetical protein
MPGVLIAAARGTTEVSARAMAIFDDPARSFASSEFIRLEVLPKSLFNVCFESLGSNLADIRAGFGDQPLPGKSGLKGSCMRKL